MTDKYKCEMMDPTDEEFLFVTHHCWSTHAEHITTIKRIDVARVVRNEREVAEWTHGNVLLFHGTDYRGGRKLVRLLLNRAFRFLN